MSLIGWIDVKKYFSNKLFMWKVRLLGFFMNSDEKHLKKIHCSKGFHLFWKDKGSITKNRELIYSWEFFRCSVCNSILFPNKREQEMYEQWKKIDGKDAMDQIRQMRKEYLKKQEKQKLLRELDKDNYYN